MSVTPTDPDQFADYGADDPVVCAVHLRFVPCRHGEPGSECFRVTNPIVVKAVAAYQRSEIDEREARMAIDGFDEWARPEVERSAFWDDLTEDLKDPEFASEYANESIRVAAIDQARNENE